MRAGYLFGPVRPGNADCEARTEHRSGRPKKGHGGQPASVSLAGVKYPRVDARSPIPAPSEPVSRVGPTRAREARAPGRLAVRKHEQPRRAGTWPSTGALSVPT